MTDFSDIFDMEWAPATAKAADERADLEAEYRALEAETNAMEGRLMWHRDCGHFLTSDDQKRLDEIEARLAEIEGVLS